jgi:hypothetical protein
MKQHLAAIAAAFIALLPATAPSAELPHSKLTITSVISLDTTAHTATFPLHKATEDGRTVWYIVTDASDAAVAKKLGVNFAPNLAGVGAAATQKATKNSDGTYHLEGAPSFKPVRTYVASAGGFPPKSATPGGKADPGYSPFVHFDGIPGVINAPVVATGDGPFDVTTHTNTEDRVVAIDTANKTVTLVLARGFFNGKPILYLSTESSDPVASSVERATFTPKLGKAIEAAEIPIGVVVDGPKTGAEPQGLAYLALQTPLDKDATAANAASIASSFNVLSLAPDLSQPYAQNGYTPLWNVFVVGTKQEKRLTNYGEIAPMSKAAGFVVNCPVVAYE